MLTAETIESRISMYIYLVFYGKESAVAGKYLAKKPRKKGRKLVLGILLILFASLAAFSGWKLLSVQQEYDVGTQTYADLVESAVRRPEPEQEPEQETTIFLPTQTEQTLPQTPTEPEAPQRDPADELLSVDFALLESINPDVVAWISSPDGISYPVVQGADNSYYLNHLFDGTENRNGSIFVDCRNAPGFADRNTFIYGHNMRNGTMFAGLANYSSQSYYETYPKLLLTTPEQTWVLQVFAGYITPGNSDIYQLTFENDENFEAYLQKIRALSDFTSDVAVTAQDRIVTLSTCTYDYEDARYILHCKLVPVQ